MLKGLGIDAFLVIYDIMKITSNILLKAGVIYGKY